MVLVPRERGNVCRPQPAVCCRLTHGDSSGSEPLRRQRSLDRTERDLSSVSATASVPYVQKLWGAWEHGLGSYPDWGRKCSFLVAYVHYLFRQKQQKEPL